jgi:NADPH-dependent 2,4-dienoyl-CoA reductase/sulfur reductase-like enzyme
VGPVDPLDFMRVDLGIDDVIIVGAGVAGLEAATRALANPVGDTLVFAGEAVHGALLTGERAARQLKDRLHLRR